MSFWKGGDGDHPGCAPASPTLPILAARGWAPGPVLATDSRWMMSVGGIRVRAEGGTRQLAASTTASPRRRSAVTR
jgi:hypothetical protein